MNTDKKVLYIISGIFSGILLLCCFVPKHTFTNLVFAAVLAVFALVFALFIKKRSILKIQHRQVALLMGGIAALVITVYFLSGLYFGFARSPLPQSFLLKYVIPFIISAVSAEVIRRVLTSANNKIADALSYITLTVFDVIILSGDFVFKSHASFMEFLSIALFPSVTANLLYTYVSKKYGVYPNVIYRILISLYPFFIKVKPNLPDVLFGLIKVTLPLLVLWFVHILYEPKKFTVKRKNKVAQGVSLCLFLIIALGVVLLTSCRFRFGLLVIATESMTGSVNKGDAVIYEEYDGSPLKEGEIIVFGDENGRRTVHRITDIEKTDGNLRVYTKGDANQESDQGFRTADNIIGTVKLKIKYLGYPTVWMRELFK